MPGAKQMRSTGVSHLHPIEPQQVYVFLQWGSFHSLGSSATYNNMLETIGHTRKTQIKPTVDTRVAHVYIEGDLLYLKGNQTT